MTDLTVVVCVAFDRRAPVDGLRAFKKCVLACEYVESALEVSGSFDLIVEGKISSLAEFTEQMERIAPQISMFVSRMETNFVARKVERYGVDQMMWLPCKDGRRKVAVSTIDKIKAEGDYMRIFVGDWDCLLHDTARILWHTSRKISSSGFIVRLSYASTLLNVFFMNVTLGLHVFAMGRATASPNHMSRRHWTSYRTSRRRNKSIRLWLVHSTKHRAMS